MGTDVRTFQIECRDMVVKPGGQAEFIVELAVRPAVGRVGRRGPVGMGGQRRALDVHVVGHIVEDYVLVVGMGFVEEVAKLRLGSVAYVHSRSVVRPVAVIAAELGFGIVNLAPGVIGVLGDR